MLLLVLSIITLLSKNEMKTRTIQIEYIKYMTNNHRHDIKILFISSCYYYKTVSSTSQMISNITDNENDIKHFLVTINDLENSNSK